MTSKLRRGTPLADRWFRTGLALVVSAASLGVAVLLASFAWIGAEFGYLESSDRWLVIGELCLVGLSLFVATNFVGWLFDRRIRRCAIVVSICGCGIAASAVVISQLTRPH